MKLPSRIVLLVTLVSSGAASAEITATVTADPAAPAPIVSDYTDSLAGLSDKAREIDANPDARYSYCVRSMATYECLSYDRDGNVHHGRSDVVGHGTAFAYRRDGDDTLLLTNAHVPEWPAVTDDDHPVEGVSAGCKMISQTAKIVDDEDDAYAADDVPLQVVVSDPQLDVAVLRAHAKLQILPWKVGHSASLRERALVEVRGFPLGAFATTSIGKVTSAYRHDDFKDWDHDDFVADALLSPGNSGSPVLAISTRSGEFELVGIFHAHYIDGSALNLVIGIDQVRDLMTTLKRSPHAKNASAQLDRASREALVAQLGGDPSPFFPFGDQIATVTARPDGVLIFAVYGRDFPVKAQPILVALDAPSTDAAAYGAVERVLWGGERGLKSYERADLDAETQAQLARVVDGLRRAAAATFSYRAAARDEPSSRAAFEIASRMEKTLARTKERLRDVTSLVQELSSRLAPAGTEGVISFADAGKLAAERL